MSQLSKVMDDMFNIIMGVIILIFVVTSIVLGARHLWDWMLSLFV